MKYPFPLFTALLVTAFASAFLFASCGDDDDDSSGGDYETADDDADDTGGDDTDSDDDAADDTSGDDTSDDTADDTTDDDTGGTVVDVDIPGFSFSPASVVVNVGDTVRWTNSHAIHHTVTSGAPDDVDAGSLFDSGEMLQSDTFEFTFTDAGTFPYFCFYHVMMTGEVIVN